MIVMHFKTVLFVIVVNFVIVGSLWAQTEFKVTASGGSVGDQFGNSVLGSLVAHYPFDGSANDLSGNDHHGSVFGASLTTDRFGNLQGAYTFDGFNDFIEVPSNPDFDGITEEITLSGWIKRDKNDLNDSFIFSRRPNTGGPMHFTVKISPSPFGLSLQWDGVDQPSPGYSVYATANHEYARLNDGDWHHVAVTYNYGDGEEPSLYIDGQAVPGIFTLGNSNYAPVIQEGPVLFGKQLSISAGSYNGALDDLRIYDRMLTSNEILELCQEGGWDCSSGTSPPQVANIEVATETETPTLIELKGTASGGEALTYRVIQTPINGNVSVEGTTAIYTANSGFSGTDTFTYVANDGTSDSNEGIVTIVVSDGPPPPQGLPGTTVIIHGHRGIPNPNDDGITEDQEWTLTMAQAIILRLGQGSVYVIGCPPPNDDKGGCEPEIVEPTELENVMPGASFQIVKTGEETIETKSETVIVFDWLEESNDDVHGYSEGAADALMALLIKGAIEEKWDLKNLHFIGHSRGTVVASETIQRLGWHSLNEGGTSIGGVAIDQNIHFTALDPHPWDNEDWDQIAEPILGYGSADDHDVNEFANPVNFLSVDSLETLQKSVGVVCWRENVSYCENYWQGGRRR